MTNAAAHAVGSHDAELPRTHILLPELPLAHTPLPFTPRVHGILSFLMSERKHHRGELKKIENKINTLNIMILLKQKILT